MALTFVAASAPVFGTTTTNPTAQPTLPTGTASGDRVYIICGSKPSGTAITGTTGWTSLSAGALGSTTVTVLARTYDGVWTMPTLQVVGSTTTGAIGAAALTYRPDSGFQVVSEAVTTGADTTSGTGYSTTGAANLNLASGDAVMALVGATVNATATSPTLTATGATIANLTEQADAGTANGADVSVKAHTADVTAGTSSAAPVHALTLSAAGTGGTVFVRVRQSALPPFTVVGEASNSTSGSTGTTLTVNTPAGTAVGDTIVLIQQNDFYTLSNLGTPSGTAVTTWTEDLGARYDGGSNQMHQKVWTGVVTTSGSQTVVAAVGSQDEEKYIQIIVLPGPGTYVIEDSVEEVEATSNPWVASGVTPISSASLMTVTAGTFGGSTADYTFPGSMTPLTEQDASFASWRSAYEYIGAAGATGTRSITLNATRQGLVTALAIAQAAPGSVTKQQAHVVNRARIIRAANW